MGRRVKTRAGKIDLVSLPLFGPVCFVEVKARNIGRDVAEPVAPTQRTRIARAASLYLDILHPGAGFVISSKEQKSLTFDLSAFRALGIGHEPSDRGQAWLIAERRF